ncbi:MAG: IS200/IS605 family transposase [Ignavibacteria bacterium]|nr:IS200/IS605 family transposase [Ignavibacteria bacterium]
MPYTKLWIHMMWSTKNRVNQIDSTLKPELLKHIKENSINKKFHIDFQNCVSDHIHILINHHPDHKLSDVIQLIKGESSYWINKNKIIKSKFEWQDEYIAVSVSESIVNKVRDYIKNQEEHHKKLTFMDEYNEFIRKYGFGK